MKQYGGSRRQFLKAAAAGGGMAILAAEPSKVSIFVVSDASDPIVTAAPVQWAVGQLRAALENKGLLVKIQGNLEGVDEAALRVVIAPANSAFALRALEQGRVSMPRRAESLGIVSSQLRGKPALMLTGTDPRGLVYAILELADRIRYGDAREAIEGKHHLAEQPANEIRSVQRLFVSDVEDKGWYNDKSFWTEYLSMLAAERFNRFSLTLGLGYDLPHDVLDSYFIFSYPFLLREVPGYRVSVPGLPAAEVDSNLAMLKWISEQAAARGLHFQLSLWSQTYKWINSPKANYVIEGLNDSNHAAYCRDALRMLLRECPAISGVTLRAHSESGIGDGSYEFWRTLFSGIADCGRRLELDLHSKGIEHKLIQMAVETGQPVRVSAKYTAEHMGLPGHQIEIRELERNRPSSTPQERAFTRYGYADYLAEDRAYGTYFRLWPGKDRVVLWGDPAIAAGYGRYSSFCGALGLEMCEPMSFKGRQGSGLNRDRRIYADPSIAQGGEDWKKYLYTYRLWGRHLYNPDADPESYRRFLRAQFNAAALPAETALANASKVIPLVTSAHLPSAAGMTYWPEIYSNMPAADETQRHIYGDTPAPKTFGHVSPLDPGLFMNAAEFVEEMSGAPASGRYSPAEVANWLDAFAATAEQELTKARAAAGNPNSPAFRRLETDVQAQLGLGRFFAAKMRSAIAWELFRKHQKRQDLSAALFFAKSAVEAWKSIVSVTQGIYLPDLTFGDLPHRRGSWASRLPAIEQEASHLESLLDEAQRQPPAPVEAWLKSRPAPPKCEHRPSAGFVPGQPLTVELAAAGGSVASALIYYRHVNQGERFRSEPMARRGGKWGFQIPGDYTNSPFALQYYFQVSTRGGAAYLVPGLAPDLANQAFYTVQGLRTRS